MKVLFGKVCLFGGAFLLLPQAKAQNVDQVRLAREILAIVRASDQIAFIPADDAKKNRHYLEYGHALEKYGERPLEKLKSLWRRDGKTLEQLPHFEILRVFITELLNSGRASTLEEALQIIEQEQGDPVPKWVALYRSRLFPGPESLEHATVRFFRERGCTDFRMRPPHLLDIERCLQLKDLPAWRLALAKDYYASNMGEVAKAYLEINLKLRPDDVGQEVSRESASLLRHHDEPDSDFWNVSDREAEKINSVVRAGALVGIGAFGGAAGGMGVLRALGGFAEAGSILSQLPKIVAFNMGVTFGANVVLSPFLPDVWDHYWRDVTLLTATMGGYAAFQRALGIRAIWLVPKGGKISEIRAIGRFRNTSYAAILSSRTFTAAQVMAWTALATSGREVSHWVNRDGKHVTPQEVATTFLSILGAQLLLNQTVACEELIRTTQTKTLAPVIPLPQWNPNGEGSQLPILMSTGTDGPRDVTFGKTQTLHSMDRSVVAARVTRPENPAFVMSSFQMAIENGNVTPEALSGLARTLAREYSLNAEKSKFRTEMKFPSDRAKSALVKSLNQLAATNIVPPAVIGQLHSQLDLKFAQLGEMMDRRVASGWVDLGLHRLEKSGENLILRREEIRRDDPPFDPTRDLVRLDAALKSNGIATQGFLDEFFSASGDLEGHLFAPLYEGEREIQLALGKTQLAQEKEGFEAELLQSEAQDHVDQALQLWGSDQSLDLSSTLAKVWMKKASEGVSRSLVTATNDYSGPTHMITAVYRGVPLGIQWVKPEGKVFRQILFSPRKQVLPRAYGSRLPAPIAPYVRTVGFRQDVYLDMVGVTFQDPGAVPQIPKNFEGDIYYTDFEFFPRTDLIQVEFEPKLYLAPGVHPDGFPVARIVGFGKLNVPTEPRSTPVEVPQTVVKKTSFLPEREATSWKPWLTKNREKLLGVIPDGEESESVILDSRLFSDLENTSLYRAILKAWKIEQPPEEHRIRVPALPMINQKLRDSKPPRLQLWIPMEGDPQGLTEEEGFLEKVAHGYLPLDSQRDFKNLFQAILSNIDARACMELAQTVLHLGRAIEDPLVKEEIFQTVEFVFREQALGPTPKMNLKQATSYLGRRIADFTRGVRPTVSEWMATEQPSNPLVSELRKSLKRSGYRAPNL